MEITLQDKNFRIGKLSALQQFYVFKRLSPVLPAIAIGIGSLKSFADADSKEERMPNNELVGLFSPIIDVFSKIPDDEMDFILKTSLSVVQIQSGKEWHPVAVNGQIMYDSIDVADMLTLVYYVNRDDILNFIQKTVTNLVAAG